MLKKSTCWTVLLYGILMIILGFIGYCQAGSKMSLIMGGSFGALLVLCAFFLFAKKRWAGYTSVVITAVLTIAFIIRSTKTDANLPAILSVLSGGILLFLLAKTVTWKGNTTSKK